MVEYTFIKATSSKEAFQNLYDIVTILRSENGCPYDKSLHTKDSLASLIDEAYEYLDGANNNDISTEDTALKNFEPYITELSEINLSLKKCINGVTINSKSASSILNDDLKQLEELKGKVSAVVIANNNTPNIIPTLISCRHKVRYP